MKFAGLSAFPITPADDDGVVDIRALRVLVQRLAGAGVDSIGLLGSTGSAPYLSRAERRRAVEAAIDEAAGCVPVIVGIGALRTSEAMALARDAAGCGAAAVLLAPVSYTPLTDDEVFAHFQAVAGVAGVPVCIYNNPGTTHFTIGPALAARLSRIAGVAALKNPAPPPQAVAAELAALRAVLPAGFSIGASVDMHATEALLAGYQAWYSVLAGTLPQACVPIMRAAAAGEAATARALDARLQPLWDLFAEYTSLRTVYAIVNLLGLCRAAPPRPLLTLDAAAHRRIAAALEDLGLMA